MLHLLLSCLNPEMLGKQRLSQYTGEIFTKKTASLSLNWVFSRLQVQNEHILSLNVARCGSESSDNQHQAFTMIWLLETWEEAPSGLRLDKSCSKQAHRSINFSWNWKWSCSVVSDSLRPVDSSPPNSSVHGILQARILEWVAISFSRGSTRPRDRT